MKTTFIYINDYLQDNHETYDITIIRRLLSVNGFESYINRYAHPCKADDIFLHCNKDSDIIGIYLYDFITDIIFDLCTQIKSYNPNSTIIFFGPMASLASEKIVLDCSDVDGIILGDPEEVFLDIVRCIGNKRSLSSVKSLYTRNSNKNEKKHAISNICEVPFVSTKTRHVQMITSRGCFGNCSFCIHSNYYYKEQNVFWIGMDAQQIINQINALKNESDVYYISLYDKCFSDPPGIEGNRKLEELCLALEIRDWKLAFSCFFRADSFNESNSMLIPRLRNVGFTHVNIGIESACEEDLKLFKKGTSVKMNTSIMNMFIKSDIDVTVDFIMFHPLSSKEAVRSNLNFLEKYSIYRLDTFFSRLRLFYNSPIYLYFKECGHINDSFSYKDTFNYTYKQKSIGSGVRFLESLFASTQTLMHAHKKFLDFCEFYNVCRIIFPNETILFADEIKKTKVELSVCITNYFRLIFIDENIDKAKELSMEWSHKLISLYNTHRKINFKILSNPVIMNYFR